MSEQSLVSICIPTYNSAAYLKQCLDSIASQTYKNIEVIVSDNASTDQTVSFISGYVDRYGFKLNRNSENIGAQANFNKLFSLAKGKYVAIYHADDVYERAIVEECVKVLDGHDSIGLVGTMGNIMNDDGVIFNTFRLPKHLKKLNKTIYSFDEALSGILKRGWFFVTPSIMMRKTALDEAGVFEPGIYGSAGDYELWLRIAVKHNVAILDKKLINYRVHKNQGTEREVRKNPEVADIVSVIKRYKELTANKKVKKMCDDCINANIIKAGRRQNYYGLYDKSNQTLKTLTSNKLIFLIHKAGITFFNILRISIKKRALSGK